MSFLDNHEKDCTFTQPCAICRANTYLARHLTDTQYFELTAIASSNENSSLRRFPLDAMIEDLPGYEQFDLKMQRLLKIFSLFTIHDVARKSESELSKLPGIGQKYLDQLQSLLNAFDYRIAERWGDPER